LSLTGSEKRELSKRGHTLKPQVTLSADEISEGQVAHLRHMFEKLDLIKVRLAAESREARELAAQQLAEQVPCELVQQIGHVVLLYLPRAAE